MKYIDLFAGIGGFRLGIERAFDNRRVAKTPELEKENSTDIKRSNGNGGWTNTDCVYTNEWDKYAAQIYEKNFGGTVDTRDITTIDASELPDFDILCGGFPCQAFSVAGNRAGFNDTRGTLFFDIARICKVKRPRYLLLENVKGLLSHDNGKTFQTILGVLTDLGYDCQWQVFNSKNFGVPQNRERVFIVGHLRGQRRPQVFPIEGDNQKAVVGPVTASAGRNRSTGSNYVAEMGTYRTYRDGAGFRKMKSKLSPTLPARARNDGTGSPLLFNGIWIRRLTPIECARLQGFPDNWCEGLSDTQAYKCYGNAVTVNVVQAIMERLSKYHND